MEKEPVIICDCINQTNFLRVKLTFVSLKPEAEVVKNNIFIFSRDEATLYEGVSVGRMDGRMDGNQLFFSANYERHMSCIRPCLSIFKN